MTLSRWAFRSFRKDKICFEERYNHSMSNEFKNMIPHKVLAEDTVILIPDGRFLRIYLQFFEEILENHSWIRSQNCLSLILLESAAEIMNHRHTSPSELFSNGTEQLESTCVNERKRIFRLWEKYNCDSGNNEVNVFPFADLSLRGDDDDDDFDIFGYDHMAIHDRSRCALLRAAHFISKMGRQVKPKIIMLSEDNQLHHSKNDSKESESILLGPILNYESFVSFLISECSDIREKLESDLLVQHWTAIQNKCNEEYTSRNKANDSTGIFQETDRYGHFDYFSEGKLQKGNFFKSVLKVTDANPTEAYCAIHTPNGDRVEYYLNKNHGHFNRAIHNDDIFIEPLPQEQWQQPVGKRRLVHVDNLDDANNKPEPESSYQNPVPTARVVGVSNEKYQRRKFVATMLTSTTNISRRDENNVLVIPMDMKIPCIRLNTRIDRERIKNKRLLIEIDYWNVGSNFPCGHVVKILGEVGDLNAEVDCLLRENSIDLAPFSANALACLPSVAGGSSWNIQDEEIRKRRDLRDRRIFSVDPIGCQDIDDAMHAKVLSNGDIEIGVHIADVTYFLQHRSSLDKEAGRRATTFYLVDRRFDMLPSLLSSDLCSLHGGVDRLAVSVIWVYSSNFDAIKSTWYGRTVIHNVQAMTYEQAHNILRDKPPEGMHYTHPPRLTAGYPVDKKQKKGLRTDLVLLTNLANKQRKHREKHGAVDLSRGDNGSEVKFVLDEFGNPTKVVPKKDLEIHHTIAELMIMGNSFVAATIYTRYPDTALLRIHRSANVEKFDELESLMKDSGSSFDGKSNKTLSQSLSDARTEGNWSVRDDLFQSLATRAMSEAQYVCTGALDGDGSLSHYGLGIDLYTHFTSPIRRYADVIVHRLLLESLIDSNHNGKNSILHKITSDAKSVIPKSDAISVLQRNGGILVDDSVDPVVDKVESLALETSSQELHHDKVTIIDPHCASRQLYQTTELSKTCNVLNMQNRTAKLSSMQCQRLFLSLYFHRNTEVADAIIIGLRQNGLIVYVPKFDVKGPAFFTDKLGNIQIDPKLVHLPPHSGLPPTSTSLNFEGCRIFPDGRCSLHDEDNDSNATLNLQLLSSNINMPFHRLDVLKVRLSCDLTNMAARISPPHIHIISIKDSHTMPSSGNTVIPSAVTTIRLPDTTSSDERNLTEMHGKSLFSVISSILVKPTLKDTPLRYEIERRRGQVKTRVQMIKGRIYMNDFHAEKLQSDLIDNDTTHERKFSTLADQAMIGDYNASKQIEREATSRMQRVAAGKQNAKRSKATKRK